MSTTMQEKLGIYEDQIKSEIQNYSLIPVDINRIQKNGDHFNYNGKMIGDEACKGLMNIFRLQEKIVHEIKDDNDQWIPLHRAITNIKHDKGITAVYNRSTNVIRAFENKPIKEETPVDLNRGFDMIRGYFETNGDRFKLKNFHFNPDTLSIEVNVNSPEMQVDVFGDNNDLWEFGFGVSYGLNKTQVYPFYERLVCANGMKAVHKMSQRFFYNNEFKDKTFNRIINNTLDNDFIGNIKKSCNNLKENNASLREFYSARNVVRSESKEEAEGFFPETDIVVAYNDKKISNRNKRWLSTANSNINAYDFFNICTNVATHNTNLTQGVKNKLNMIASNMFTNGPDFSFRAPNPFSNN